MASIIQKMLLFNIKIKHYNLYCYKLLTSKKIPWLFLYIKLMFLMENIINVMYMCNNQP